MMLFKTCFSCSQIAVSYIDSPMVEIWIYPILAVFLFPEHLSHPLCILPVVVLKYNQKSIKRCSLIPPSLSVEWT